MRSSQKLVIEPTAGVNEAKICLNIAENHKYSSLQCNNSNTIKFFNIFLCFSEKACLSIMISRKKVIIETKSWTKDKSFPKNCQNLQIFILTM